MNRLHTRLVLAMLIVALFSAGIMVVSQTIGARLHFRSLPADVQDNIRQRREYDAALRKALAAGETIDAEVLPPPPRLQSEDPSPFIRVLEGVRDYQRWASFIGVSLAALFIARAIARPIERVSHASSEVARGNLSVQVLERAPYSGHEVQLLNQNFNRMTRSLESYETERRDMIASIAHDLRTPLTAIKLRLTALQDEIVPLSQAEVSLLLSQADAFERLVNDLRILSLADAGRLSLQRQPTNITALIKEVQQSYQQRAETQGVALLLETQQDIQALVDPGRIKQIMVNLFDNALRVSPVNSHIEIALEDRDDCVRISVSDEGTGIAESLLPHIFDRYVKDKDSGGSSGLGLAITKTLIELHGGTIRAYNHQRGASFLLDIPKVPTL